MLLFAISDTIDAGEVVSDELDEFELNNVDELTEVGGVLADMRVPGGEAPASWALSWLPVALCWACPGAVVSSRWAGAAE